MILQTCWIPYERGYAAPELNGINVWLQRFKKNAADHERLRCVVVGCCRGDFKFPRWVDVPAGSMRAGTAALKAAFPQTDIWTINGCYDWLSLVAQSRSLLRQKPLTIAIVHNDNWWEYYAPLAYFEPLIDLFVAVSDECRDNLLREIPHRAASVSVLPCFIPTPVSIAVRERDLNEPIRLIYAGRIRQAQKRVFDLVELVSHLAKSQINFRMSIAGEGDDRGELASRLDAAGVGVFVDWLGCVDHNEIGQVFSRHDVFVQVSDTEGTSVSMLEAMANGLVPVVTRATSGIAGVVDEGVSGFTVDVGNMRSLAAIVVELYHGRGSLLALKAAAARKGKQYGWETYQRGLLDMITNVSTRPILRSWPHDRDPVPDSAPWARCWSDNKPPQSGRLDAVPMPKSLRRMIRRLLH